MDNYIGIEFLGTMAGMIIVLNLVVQFFKPLIFKLTKIPAQYVVWFLAIVLSVTYQLVAGEFTVESIFVMILNTIIVTLASMKSYDFTIKKVEERIQMKKE